MGRRAARRFSNRTVQESEERVRRVEEELLARGFAKRGERIVIVFGAPVGQAGKINSLRLHTISM